MYLQLVYSWIAKQFPPVSILNYSRLYIFVSMLLLFGKTIKYLMPNQYFKELKAWKIISTLLFINGRERWKENSRENAKEKRKASKLINDNQIKEQLKT